MIEIIATSFFFILPIILAGLTLILFLKKGWLQSLKYPIDFGLTIGNKRVLGKNKTWLGLVMMSLGTLLFTILLAPLATRLSFKLPLYDLSFVGLAKAALLGAAYALGELPNSFIKRQLNISEGAKSNQPFLKMLFVLLDNIDSIIVVIIAAGLLYAAPLAVLITMAIIGSLIHFSTDVLMKFMRLK